MSYLGGYDHGECLSAVEAYDVNKNSWSPLKPMLKARCHFAVAQMANRLYACGGSDGHKELSSVECFDPQLETWTSLPEMTVHRSSAGNTQLNFLCFFPKNDDKS